MTLHFKADYGSIYLGNAMNVLREMPDESVHCCVTSPPYWGLRDYGVDGQIGLEASPEEYVSKLVEVFREVRRVLLDGGTLWLNLGDSYSREGGKTLGCKRHWDGRERDCGSDSLHSRPLASEIGLKPKDLIGIPWRTAFALQTDGWYLRSDIIWHKPNPMPESVIDRPTKSHEYLFLMSKSAKYFYDHEAVREGFADERMGNPGGGGQYAVDAFALLGTQRGLSKGRWNEDGRISGRNKRSVWTIATKPFSEAHFATFPPALIEPCILAGCPVGGTVLDPFFGAGTTGVVSYKLDRKFVGIELSQKYLDEIAIPRIQAEAAQLKLFA